MEPIPETYTNGSYTMKLLESRELPDGTVAAIYQQAPLSDTYEVIRLVWKEESKTHWGTAKAHWSVPKDKEWGTRGWTVQGFINAKALLTEIQPITRKTGKKALA